MGRLNINTLAVYKLRFLKMAILLAVTTESYCRREKIKEEYVKNHKRNSRVEDMLFGGVYNI